MNLSVFGVGIEDGEILDPIVGWVAVEMMDDLVRCQWSSDVFFHNVTVLVPGVAVGEVQDDVAIWASDASNARPPSGLSLTGP